MRRFARTASLWLPVVALVVLAARWIVYQLSPSPLALALQRQAGGPRLLVVAGIALGLAFAVGASVVALAALAVRERGLLEARPARERPRLSLVRLAARTVALWAATALAFALVESTIHWREGLGWHGLHCLVGPAHADAVPVLLALSFLAAALVAASEHVLAWLGRTLARLDDSLCGGPSPLLPALRPGRLVLSAVARSSLRPRAPPRWISDPQPALGR
ncbi:MAG: hypothetical protein ACXVZN_05505 [Gaiellaceae bacterium]